MTGRSSGPALRVIHSSPSKPTLEIAEDRPSSPGDDTGQVRLEAIYERYAPYVAAIATRILGRQAEVEDLVQDVFAVAVHNLRRREDHREIKSWLATVTVRRSMQHLRMRRIWSLLDLDAEPNYERLADPTVDQEERQLIAEVYRALDRLPARQRVPWTLRYIEGESLERTAELCGCSLATVKRRIAAAHDRVRNHLRGAS